MTCAPTGSFSTAAPAAAEPDAHCGESEKSERDTGLAIPRDWGLSAVSPPWLLLPMSDSAARARGGLPIG